METTERTELVVRPNGQQQDVIRAAGQQPAENYVAGFDGMATSPFDEKITKILRAPIPEQDVEIKPDGIVYLPGIFYRQRLMDAFGPGGWAIAPRTPPKRAPAAGGELVMYHGALFCHGRYVSEAVGQCVYYPQNAGMTYADAFEGAKTDCITRCCKDLGIAKELWDPTWREQWQSKYAHQVKRRAQIWNAETRKKEWGEKTVWERRGRAQKLGTSPAQSSPVSAAAAGGGGSGTTSGSPPPATGAPAGAIVDTGEAMSPEHLKTLEGLTRELKWKKQWKTWWFTRRFGVDHAALSEEQYLTATRLLLAFSQGPDVYGRELAVEAAAGHCTGPGDDEAGTVGA